MAENNNGTVFTFTVKASTDTTELEKLKSVLEGAKQDVKQLSDSFTRVKGLESLSAGAEDFAKSIEHATYNIEKAQKAFASGLSTKSERQEMLRGIDRDLRDIQTRKTMLESTQEGAGFSISGINKAVGNLGKELQQEFAKVLPQLQTAIKNSISTDNIRRNVLSGGLTAKQIEQGTVLQRSKLFGGYGSTFSAANIGNIDQIVESILNPTGSNYEGLDQSAGAIERSILAKIQGANEKQKRNMLRLAVGSVVNPMQSKEYRATRADIEQKDIEAYKTAVANARNAVKTEHADWTENQIEKEVSSRVHRIMTGFGLSDRTSANVSFAKIKDAKTVFDADYGKQYTTLKTASNTSNISPIEMLPEIFRSVFKTGKGATFISRAVPAVDMQNGNQVLNARGLATLLKQMNNNAIFEQAMIDSGIATRSTSGSINLPTSITKQDLFEKAGEALTGQFITHTKGLKHEIGEAGVDRTTADRGVYGELADYWTSFVHPDRTSAMVNKMRAGTGARSLNAMRAFQDIIMSSGDDNLWENNNTPGTMVADRLKQLAKIGYSVPNLNAETINVKDAYKALSEIDGLGFTEAGQRRAKNMYAVKKYDPFTAAIQALQGNLTGEGGRKITFDEVIAEIPKMLKGSSIIGSTMETINESQITDLLNYGLDRKGTPLVGNYGDISGLIRQIDLAKLQTLVGMNFKDNKGRTTIKGQDAANQVLDAIMAAYGTDVGDDAEWRGAAAHGFSESQVLRVINAKRAKEVNDEYRESVARAYALATGQGIDAGREYAKDRDIFRNLTSSKDREYKNAKAQGKGFEALNKAWTDSYVIGNFSTFDRADALREAGLGANATDQQLRAAGYRQSVIEDGKWTNSPSMALIDLARARKIYKYDEGQRVRYDARIHSKDAQWMEDNTIVDPRDGKRYLAEWKGFEATNGLGYADSRYLNSGAQVRGALGLKGSLQAIDTQGKTLAEWAYNQGIAQAIDKATGQQITGSIEDYIKANANADIRYYMQGFSADLQSREKLETGSGRQGAMADITNAQVLMDESLIKNMDIYKNLANDILTRNSGVFGGETDIKKLQKKAAAIISKQSLGGTLTPAELAQYNVAQEWANATANRGSELMSGLIELSPIRAATEYKHDKANSSAIGGQMAKFLGLNPEFMAYQQEQSLARLQDLRTAGGARKFIFGDAEEDEFSREFNDEALGDAYMAANLGGIYERKKKEFMRSRSIAAGNAQIFNYDPQGMAADGIRYFGAIGNIADKRLLDNILTTSMLVSGQSQGGANALEEARKAGRYDETTLFDINSESFKKVFAGLKNYWGDTAITEQDVQRWLNLEGGLIDFEKQGYMVGTGARAPNGFGQYIGGINYAGVFNPIKSMFGSSQGLFVSNNYKGGMSGADMDADEAKMIYSNLYDVSRWGLNMGREDQDWADLTDKQKAARDMYMDMIRTLEGTGNDYIGAGGNVNYKNFEKNLAAFREKYQTQIAHNFGLDKDTVQRTAEEIQARKDANDKDTAAVGKLNDAEIRNRIEGYAKRDLTSSMIKTLKQYDIIKMDAMRAGYDPLQMGLDFDEKNLNPEQIAKAYGIDIRVKDNVRGKIGNQEGLFKAIFRDGKYRRGFLADGETKVRELNENDEGYADAYWGEKDSGMFNSRLMQEVYTRRAAEAAMYMGRASDAGSRLSMLDLNDPINKIFARTAAGSNRLYDIYTTWQKKPSEVIEPKSISNALKLGNEYAKGINWINGSMARQLVGYYKDAEGNYIAEELHNLINPEALMTTRDRNGNEYTLDRIGAYSQASAGNLHPLGRDADTFGLKDASKDNLIGGRFLTLDEVFGAKGQDGKYKGDSSGIIKETSAGDFFYMGDLGNTLGTRNSKGGYKIDALNLPSVYNPADLTGLMTRRNSMIAGLGDTSLALSLAEVFDSLDTGVFEEGTAGSSLLKNMRYIKAGFMGGTRDIITDAEMEILLRQRYAAEAQVDQMVAAQDEEIAKSGIPAKYGYKLKTGTDSNGKDIYEYGLTREQYRNALIGNLGLNQVDLMLGTYKDPETGEYLETGMTYTNMAWRALQNDNLAYRQIVGRFIDPIDNYSVNLLNEETYDSMIGNTGYIPGVGNIEDPRATAVQMVLDQMDNRRADLRRARNYMSEDDQMGLMESYFNIPNINITDESYSVMREERINARARLEELNRRYKEERDKAINDAVEEMVRENPDLFASPEEVEQDKKEREQRAKAEEEARKAKTKEEPKPNEGAKFTTATDQINSAIKSWQDYAGRYAGGLGNADALSVITSPESLINAFSNIDKTYSALTVGFEKFRKDNAGDLSRLASAEQVLESDITSPEMKAAATKTVEELAQLREKRTQFQTLWDRTSETKNALMESVTLAGQASNDDEIKAIANEKSSYEVIAKKIADKYASAATTDTNQIKATVAKNLGDNYQKALESMASGDRDLVFWDTETTGRDASTANLMQLSAVKYNTKTKTWDKFNRFVTPQEYEKFNPINNPEFWEGDPNDPKNKGITAVNHIRPEQVYGENASTATSAVTDFFKFIGLLNDAGEVQDASKIAMLIGQNNSHSTIRRPGGYDNNVLMGVLGRDPSILAGLGIAPDNFIDILRGNSVDTLDMLSQLATQGYVQDNGESIAKESIFNILRSGNIQIGEDFITTSQAVNGANKLGPIASLFGLASEGAHDSAFDSFMAAGVFANLANIISGEGTVSPDFISSVSTSLNDMVANAQKEGEANTGTLSEDAANYIKTWSTNYAVQKGQMANSGLDAELRKKIHDTAIAETLVSYYTDDHGYNPSFDINSKSAKDIVERNQEYIKNNGTMQQLIDGSADSIKSQVRSLAAEESMGAWVNAYQQELVNFGRNMSEKDRNLLMTAPIDATEADLASQVDNIDVFMRAKKIRDDLTETYSAASRNNLNLPDTTKNIAFNDMYANAQGFNPLAQLRAAGANTPEAARLQAMQRANAQAMGLDDDYYNGLTPPPVDYSTGGVIGGNNEQGGVASLSATQVNISGSSIKIAAETVNLATAQTNADSAQTINVGDMINSMADSINAKFNEGRAAGANASVYQRNQDGTTTVNTAGTTQAQRLAAVGVDAATAAAIGAQAGQIISRGETTANSVFRDIDVANELLLTTRKQLNDTIRENANSVNPASISASATEQQMRNLDAIRSKVREAETNANNAADQEQRTQLLAVVEAFRRAMQQAEAMIPKAGIAESQERIRDARTAMDNALDKRPGEMQQWITRAKNAENAYRESVKDVAVLEKIEGDQRYNQHAGALDPNNRNGQTTIQAQLDASRANLAQMQNDRAAFNQEYDIALQDIYTGMDLNYYDTKTKSKPTNMFELRKQLLAERKTADKNISDIRSAAENELAQWKLGGRRNNEGQSLELRDNVTLEDFLSGNFEGSTVTDANGNTITRNYTDNQQRARIAAMVANRNTWEQRLADLNGPENGGATGIRWLELFNSIDQNYGKSIYDLRKLSYGGRNDFAEAFLTRDANIQKYDDKIAELRTLQASAANTQELMMYSDQEAEIQRLKNLYKTNSSAEIKEDIVGTLEQQSLKYGGIGLSNETRKELARVKAQREAMNTLESLKDTEVIKGLGGVNSQVYQDAVKTAVENLSRVVAGTVVDSSLRVGKDGKYTFDKAGTKALTIDPTNGFMSAMNLAEQKTRDAEYKSILSYYNSLTRTGNTKEDIINDKVSEAQAGIQTKLDAFRKTWAIQEDYFKDKDITNIAGFDFEKFIKDKNITGKNKTDFTKEFNLLKELFNFVDNGEYAADLAYIQDIKTASANINARRNSIKAMGGRMTDEDRYSLGREEGIINANSAMQNFMSNNLKKDMFDKKTMELTAAGQAFMANPANAQAAAAYNAIKAQQAYYAQTIPMGNGMVSAYEQDLKLQDENRSELMRLQSEARIAQTQRSLDYYNKNNRIRSFGGGMIGQSISQANMIRNQYENNILSYDRDIQNKLVNLRGTLGNNAAGESIYDKMKDSFLAVDKNGKYTQTAEQLYAQAQAQGYKGSQVDFKNQLESIRAMRSEAERMRGTLNSWNGPASTFSALITSAVTSINTAITRFTSQMLRKGWQEVKKYVVEMDTAYAKVQAITMKSDGEMESVKKYTTSTAKELHTSASNVVKVEQELYRQGLSDSEVQSRTKTVLQYSTVTGADITKSIKQLTAAVNTGLVDSLEQATDAMVALGDAAATTASEIASGLQKSAASAKVAGVSFEELTAFITIGTSKTQLGGGQIGNMLSTSMQRYRKIAAGGYDNEDGTPTNANDVEKALHTVGLSIFKEGSLTEMKDYTSIMREIAQKWSGMTDVEKSQITYAMAGTRQGNLFNTYMETLAEDNGALLDEYIEKATNSAGTTAEKYGIVTDTIQTKLTDIKNAFDDFAASLDTEGIKNILGGVANAISSFSDLGGVGGITGLAGALIGLSTGLKALFSVLGSHPIAGLIAGIVAFAGTAVASAVKKAKEEAAIAEEKAAEEKVKSNNLALERAINKESVVDDYLNKGLTYRQKYASIQETINTDDEKAVKTYLNNIKTKFPETAALVDEAIAGVNGSFDKLIEKLGELKGAADQTTKEKALKSIQQFDYTSLATEWAADQEDYFDINTRANRYRNAFSELWGEEGKLRQTDSKISVYYSDGSTRLVEPIATNATIAGKTATTVGAQQSQAALLMSLLGYHYESGYNYPRGYSGAEANWVKNLFYDNKDIMLPNTVTHRNPENGITGTVTIGELYNMSTGNKSSDYETDWNDNAKIIAMLYGWSTGRVLMTDEQSELISSYITDYNTQQTNKSLSVANAMFSDYLENGGLNGYEAYGLKQAEIENAFNDWAEQNVNEIPEMSGEEMINAFFKSYTEKDSVKDLNIADLIKFAKDIKDNYGTYAYSYNVKDAEGNIIRTVKTDSADAYTLGSQYYSDEADDFLIKQQEALNAGNNELADKYNKAYLNALSLSMSTEDAEKKGYEMLNSGEVTDTSSNTSAAKTLYSYYNPYTTSTTKRKLTSDLLGYIGKGNEGKAFENFDKLEEAINGNQELLVKYSSLFQNENIANVIQDIKDGRKNIDDLIEALKGTIDAAANFKEVNEKVKSLKSNQATMEMYQRIAKRNDTEQTIAAPTAADYAAMEADLGYSLAGLTEEKITELAQKGVAYYSAENEQLAVDVLTEGMDIINNLAQNGTDGQKAIINTAKTKSSSIVSTLNTLGYNDLAASISAQGVSGRYKYDQSLNNNQGGFKIVSAEYTGTSGASPKETFENAAFRTNTSSETLAGLNTLLNFAYDINNGKTYDEAIAGFTDTNWNALSTSTEAGNIANLLNKGNTEEAKAAANALYYSVLGQIAQYITAGLTDSNVASWVTATTDEARNNAVSNMKQVNTNLATNQRYLTKLQDGTIKEDELETLANYLGVDVSEIRGNYANADRLMKYKESTAATQQAEFDATALAKMKEEAGKLDINLEGVNDTAGAVADAILTATENTDKANSEAAKLAKEYKDVANSADNAKTATDTLNTALGKAKDNISLKTATKDLSDFLKTADQVKLDGLYDGLTTESATVSDEWRNIVSSSETALTILANYKSGLIDATTAATQLREAIDDLAPKRSAESLDDYAKKATSYLLDTDEKGNIIDSWSDKRDQVHDYLYTIKKKDPVGYTQLIERYSALEQMAQAGDENTWLQAEAAYNASVKAYELEDKNAFAGKTATEFIGYLNDYWTAKGKGDQEGYTEAYNNMVGKYGEYLYYSQLSEKENLTAEEKQSLLNYFGGTVFGDATYTANKEARDAGMGEMIGYIVTSLGSKYGNFISDANNEKTNLENKPYLEIEAEAEDANSLQDLWDQYYADYKEYGVLPSIYQGSKYERLMKTDFYKNVYLNDKYTAPQMVAEAYKQTTNGKYFDQSYTNEISVADDAYNIYATQGIDKLKDYLKEDEKRLNAFKNVYTGFDALLADEVYLTKEEQDAKIAQAISARNKAYYEQQYKDKNITEEKYNQYIAAQEYFDLATGDKTPWLESRAEEYSKYLLGYNAYQKKQRGETLTKEEAQYIEDAFGVNQYNPLLSGKVSQQTNKYSYLQTALGSYGLNAAWDSITTTANNLIDNIAKTDINTAKANAEQNLIDQQNVDNAYEIIKAAFDSNGGKFVIPEGYTLESLGLANNTDFLNNVYYNNDLTDKGKMTAFENMTTGVIVNGKGNQATVTTADLLYSYLNEFETATDEETKTAALKKARDIWKNTEGIQDLFNQYYGEVSVESLFLGENAKESEEGLRREQLDAAARYRKYKEYEIKNKYGYVSNDQYSMIQTAQEIEKAQDETQREYAVNDLLQQWQNTQNTDAQALSNAINFENVLNSDMSDLEKANKAREYVGDNGLSDAEAISQAREKINNDRAAAQKNIENILWLFDVLSGDEFASIRSDIFGEMTREEVNTAYGGNAETYTSASEAITSQSAYGNDTYYQERLYSILGSGGDRQDILNTIAGDVGLSSWIQTEGGDAANIVDQLRNKVISVDEAFRSYEKSVNKGTKALNTFRKSANSTSKTIMEQQYYLNKTDWNATEKDEVAKMLGFDDWETSGLTIDFAKAQLNDIQLEGLDDLVDLINNELGSSFRDVNGNVISVDGGTVEIGETKVINKDNVADLAYMNMSEEARAAAEHYASLGYDVQYEQEVQRDENGVIKGVSWHAVSANVNKAFASGTKSSGGGGGKSATDKLIEKWKNKIAVNQHRINMLDKTAEGYKNKGELTNYGSVLSYKNDELLALKEEYLQANEELEALYAKTSKGTKNSDAEDAIKLRDQIGAQSDYTEMYKIITALIAGNS